jgi:hypothetical protein
MRTVQGLRARKGCLCLRVHIHRETGSVRTPVKMATTRKNNSIPPELAMISLYPRCSWGGWLGNSEHIPTRLPWVSLAQMIEHYVWISNCCSLSVAFSIAWQFGKNFLLGNLQRLALMPGKSRVGSFGDCILKDFWTFEGHVLMRPSNHPWCTWKYTFSLSVDNSAFLDMKSLPVPAEVCNFLVRFDLCEI